MEFFPYINVFKKIILCKLSCCCYIVYVIMCFYKLSFYFIANQIIYNICNHFGLYHLVLISMPNYNIQMKSAIYTTNNQRYIKSLVRSFSIYQKHSIIHNNYYP